MKERLLCSTPEAQGSYVGTFHKISHLLLRRYGGYINLSTNFQIITPSDQKRMIKEGLKELSMTLSEKYSEAFVLKALSLRHQVSQEQFWEREDHSVGRLLQYYDKRCQKESLIDFDNLIIKATQLFQHPFVKENFCEKLSHICIDEFQDTNFQQILWLEALLGSKTGLTLVGDDDQSIYRFRGSDVTLMQTAHRRFEGLELIKLEQNYRSTATIVNAASEVIAKSSTRLAKTLWTQTISDEKIVLIRGKNEFAEADGVAKAIHGLIHKGVGLEEISILYRSNRQSRLFEAAARKYQWPYKLSGGLGFYDREEVKDILSYLQLITDKNSTLAFSRIINKPARKIGPKTLEKIFQLSKEYDLPVFEALIASQSLFKGKTLERIKEFINLIEEHEQYAQENSLADLTSSLIAKSELLSAYKENIEQKQDNLYELINAMIDYQNKAEGTFTPYQLLGEFLADVTLATSTDKASEQDDPMLSLSTIHAAKGLEWSYVFIVGVEEGFYPHQQAYKEEDQDEERRLFYVALTRAKKQCFMSYARYRSRGYEDYRVEPSRFLRDISSKYIQYA
jgi:DNA helicase-2/ATP-dependent DNA helicase PcrA